MSLGRNDPTARDYMGEAIMAVPGSDTCPAPETCAEVCIGEESDLLSHASWQCPDCGREVRARNGLVVGNRCDVCETLERR